MVGRASSIFKSKFPWHYRKKDYDQLILPTINYRIEAWSLTGKPNFKLRTVQRANYADNFPEKHHNSIVDQRTNQTTSLNQSKNKINVLIRLSSLS